MQKSPDVCDFSGEIRLTTTDPDKDQINGSWHFGRLCMHAAGKALTLFKSQESAEETTGRDDFRFRFSTQEATPTVRHGYLLNSFTFATLQD